MRIARLVVVATLVLAALGTRISIVDGESMAPTIRAGDAVITVAPLFGSPPAGSVLLIEAEGRRLLHRLVRSQGGSLWMKGDASVSEDSSPIQPKEVLGTLALVIPTSHLYRAIRVAARFTSAVPVDVQIASSAGVTAEQGPRYTFGADAQGQLPPGAYAMWSMLLTACGGVTGACPGSYSLQIDAAQFSAVVAPVGSVGTPSQALARSLRIATRCQAASGGAWTQTSDLFTSEWSASDANSGMLATHDGATAKSGIRCEVKVTMLGSVAASFGAIGIPLKWGPA